jgi:endonuclease YncB( thermonuclease family)
MNPSLAFLFAAALLVPITLHAEDDPTKFPGEEAMHFYRAELVRVVDGHTAIVDIDLGFFVWHRKTTIRLAGIDAPEINTPEGKAAFDWLKTRLAEATEADELRVRTVKGDDTRDLSGTWGRWFGVLFADGVCVNQEMVEKGLAKAQPKKE